MNYRHIYHAGNFADVFKHMLLITLIRSLSAKDKPFCYLDTHAGISHYDLQTEAAQKTNEAKAGIFRLWDMLQTSSLLPEPITDYLELVRLWNKQHGQLQLRFYPGSPVLARYCLRQQDRMILTEMHPEDILVLKQQYAGDKSVAVHHLNGYQGMKAFLPPREGRGLVFIDPPFENTDEFALLLQHLQLALQRFSSGVYAIWYPIKSLASVKRFYRELKASGIRKILCCEFHLPKLTDNALALAAGSKLRSSGILVINPPWHWEDTANKVLSWLSQNFTKPSGSYQVEWLVPE
ncbi:MAG TPA: 23S rRNA (adenine(2030)-N(6))-methyltransferase RlmJ [Gammaproteobacteria bacterium]|nr:23S rRNA (adenine(2030)-N(6))-methyltransferase RlmJ [Gammaproteobacteria bacterium]